MTKKNLKKRKAQIFDKCDIINKRYGAEVASAHISDSYYNMKEKILPHMELVDYAKKAMEQEGITPLIVPIRGGTDGARLSYMGLPCPNLCAGGHNSHGPYEYISIQSMEKIAAFLIRLVGIFGGVQNG